MAESDETLTSAELESHGAESTSSTDTAYAGPE